MQAKYFPPSLQFQSDKIYNKKQINRIDCNRRWQKIGSICINSSPSSYPLYLSPSSQLQTTYFRKPNDNVQNYKSIVKETFHIMFHSKRPSPTCTHTHTHALCLCMCACACAMSEKPEAMHQHYEQTESSINRNNNCSNKYLWTHSISCYC